MRATMMMGASEHVIPGPTAEAFWWWGGDRGRAAQRSTTKGLRTAFPLVRRPVRTPARPVADHRHRVRAVRPWCRVPRRTHGGDTFAAVDSVGPAESSGGIPRQGILLAAAMFVFVIDTSFMNVSISAVVHDLDTTVSGVQSAVAIEALVSAAFILISSKVGD